jgi:hypothetical protein
MRRNIILIGAAALAAGLLLFPAAFGRQGAKPDRYNAVWATVGGTAGDANIPIGININRYNTEADIQKFVDLLKEKGKEDLRFALEKEDVGFISTPKHTRVPIAIARKLTDGAKTITRVVVARNLWFIEFKFSGKAEDYPYTILQLDLDQNGKGTGTATAAAMVKFNKKKNTYEVESLTQGTVVNKLIDIQPMK